MNATVSVPPIGWPLLPRPDAHGRLAWPDLATSVRERIRLLLLMRPGALIGARGLGVGLGDFLGRPATLDTRREIRDRVTEQLARWEPRIALEGVEVWPPEEADPGRLRLEISYRLRRTGEPGVVALTMDLGG